MSKSKPEAPKKILMVDVGGTNAKCMATAQEGLVKIPSGPDFTPHKLMRELLKETKDWEYDAVTLGYPGVVVDGKPDKKPGNLGTGWVKFDFKKAFKKPVRIINDAAMQALAAYETGRMLFVGFGTSVGGGRCGFQRHPGNAVPGDRAVDRIDAGSGGGGGER